MARRKKVEQIATADVQRALGMLKALAYLDQEALVQALPAPERKGKKQFSLTLARRAKKKPENGFVAWMRETAEERAERKHANRAMAKAIRAGTASDAQVAAFVRAKKGETADSWRVLAQANGYRV